MLITIFLVFFPRLSFVFFFMINLYIEIMAHYILRFVCWYVNFGILYLGITMSKLCVSLLVNSNHQ